MFTSTLNKQIKVNLGKEYILLNTNYLTDTIRDLAHLYEWLIVQIKCYSITKDVIVATLTLKVINIKTKALKQQFNCCSEGKE